MEIFIIIRLRTWPRSSLSISLHIKTFLTFYLQPWQSSATYLCVIQPWLKHGARSVLSISRSQGNIDKLTTHSSLTSTVNSIITQSGFSGLRPYSSYNSHKTNKNKISDCLIRFLFFTHLIRPQDLMMTRLIISIF